MKQDVGHDQGGDEPAPNRATPVSGAASRSRNGIRHPLRRIVGAATAVKLSTMTHPDRTR